VLSEGTVKSLTIHVEFVPLPAQRVKGRDAPVISYKIYAQVGPLSAESASPGRPGRTTDDTTTTGDTTTRTGA
jgi:hypothetical protein